MTVLTEDSTRTQHGTTAWQAFIHLLKGYVGPGCLSLPWAISQLGVPFGILTVFVVSYWTSMNIWNVVELKRAYEATLSSSTRRLSPITYPEVGNWLYGKRFEKMLTAMICVQQLAVCTVFLSFIGENLGAAIQHSMEIQMSHALVITIVLPAAIGLTCLPNLKVLAPVMSLATMTLFLGFAVLTVLVAEQWPDRPQPYLSEIEQWRTVPLAICAVLFSFEGICLILPIETSMIDNRQFTKVFCGAMAAAAVIFALVGGLCVIAFGPVSSGSITAFLLQQADGDDLEVLFAANTLVSVAVLLTYPLQLYPSYELVGPLVAKFLSRRRTRSPDSSPGNISLHHVGTHNGYLAASSDDDDSRLPATPRNNRNSTDAILSRRGAEEEVLPNVFSDHRQDYWNYFGTSYGDTPLVRVGLVLVTYLFAIVVPNVQLLVSLAGAVSGSATGLLVPPLLQLAYVKQMQRQDTAQQASSNEEEDNNDGDDSDDDALPVYGFWYYQRRRIESYILFALGCIVLIIGTTAALRDIIRVYMGLGDE
eukprot:scaffold523_cov101-Cylindrotheca_fusiformis.AAC.3